MPELRAEACRDFGQVLSYVSEIAPVGQESSTLSAAGTVLPSDVMPMGGLLVRDSSIIVFDIAAGQLVRLDPTGRVVARMGRTGRGPGEFNPSPGMVLGDFVDAHGDTIVAYDGGSVHRFTINGQHVDSRPVPAVARPFIGSPVDHTEDDRIVHVEISRLQLLRFNHGEG